MNTVSFFRPRVSLPLCNPCTPIGSSRIEFPLFYRSVTFFPTHPDTPDLQRHSFLYFHHGLRKAATDRRLFFRIILSPSTFPPAVQDCPAIFSQISHHPAANCPILLPLCSTPPFLRGNVQNVFPSPQSPFPLGPRMFPRCPCNSCTPPGAFCYRTTLTGTLLSFTFFPLRFPPITPQPSRRAQSLLYFLEFSSSSFLVKVI